MNNFRKILEASINGFSSYSEEQKRDIIHSLVTDNADTFNGILKTRINDWDKFDDDQRNQIANSLLDEERDDQIRREQLLQDAAQPAEGPDGPMQAVVNAWERAKTGASSMTKQGGGLITSLLDEASGRRQMDAAKQESADTSRLYPAGVQSYKDITPSNAIQYVTEKTIESSPYLIPGLIGSAVGAPVAGAVGLSAGAGAILGGMAGSVPVGFSDIGGTIYERTGEIRPGVAAIGAIPYGALEIAGGELPMLMRVLRGGIVPAGGRVLGKELAKKAAWEIAKTTGEEGLVETAQQKLMQELSGVVKEKDTEELIESFVGGAAGGFGMTTGRHVTATPAYVSQANNYRNTVVKMIRSGDIGGAIQELTAEIEKPVAKGKPEQMQAELQHKDQYRRLLRGLTFERTPAAPQIAPVHPDVLAIQDGLNDLPGTGKERRLAQLAEHVAAGNDVADLLQLWTEGSTGQANVIFKRAQAQLLEARKARVAEPPQTMPGMTVTGGQARAPEVNLADRQYESAFQDLQFQDELAKEAEQNRQLEEQIQTEQAGLQQQDAQLAQMIATEQSAKEAPPAQAEAVDMADDTQLAEQIRQRDAEAEQTRQADEEVRFNRAYSIYHAIRTTTDTADKREAKRAFSEYPRPMRDAIQAAWIADNQKGKQPAAPVVERSTPPAPWKPKTPTATPVAKPAKAEQPTTGQQIKTEYLRQWSPNPNVRIGGPSQMGEEYRPAMTVSGGQAKAPEVSLAQRRASEIVTDPARIQEIKNSILEGETILKTSEFNGKKRTPEYLAMVKRQVEKDKQKIGDTSPMPKPEVKADKPAPAPEPKATEPALNQNVFTRDISISTAEAAFRGSSFAPEKRAIGTINDYTKLLMGMWNKFEQLANTPEKKAILEEEFARFRSGYRGRYLAWLSAKSRTVSSMIAGPSNFPVASNQKKMDVEQKRAEDLDAFAEKGYNAIYRAISPESFPISSDQENAVELLEKKISDAEKKQALMKACNKIVSDKKLTEIQKVEQIQAVGLSGKSARELLKPDYAGRIGFPAYELQNNLANIKRMKSRAAAVSSRKQTAGSEIRFDGGVIIDSQEENRVIIKHDQKPSAKVIESLKQHGFKWSPSRGAWVRMRGENALHRAKEITGATTEPTARAAEIRTGTTQDAEAQPEEKPVLPAKEPERITGKAAEAITPRKRRIPVRFTVVEIDSLISSDMPGYLKELQPRDRDKVASQNQIRQIGANPIAEKLVTDYADADVGTPIVGTDMMVEGGNGRTMGLRLAYANGNAEGYRQAIIDNASRFGIDPTRVEGMKNPVLIRVRQGELSLENRRQIAKEMNEDTKLAMSAGEKGRSDADAVNDLISYFMPGDTGDIFVTRNFPFLQKFFQKVQGVGDEGAFFDDEGSVTKEGRARVRNALFAAAYGDKRLVALMTEDPESNVNTVLNALVLALPSQLVVRNGAAAGTKFDLDLSQNIAQAVMKLDQLRSEGMTIDGYFAQGMLFEDDMASLAKDMLFVFDHYKKSANRIAKILNEYNAGVIRLGDPRQKEIETKKVPTRAELLLSVIRLNEEQKNVQVSLFEDPSGSGRKVDGPLAAAISARRGNIINPAQVAIWAAKGLGRQFEKGLALIRSGLTEFSKWARQMSTEFGPAIHKHLRELWKSANDAMKSIGRRGGVDARILNRAREIASRFIDAVRTVTGNPSELGEKVILPVSEREAKDILDQGGPDVSGMMHTLKADELHHAIKKHSDEEIESKKNPPQRELTYDDLKKIPDVIGDYDSIDVNIRKQNRSSIVYSKAFNDGTIVYVERIIETSKSNKPRLVTKTAWVAATTNQMASHSQDVNPGGNKNMVSKDQNVKPGYVSPFAPSRSRQGGIKIKGRIDRITGVKKPEVNMVERLALKDKFREGQRTSVAADKEWRAKMAEAMKQIKQQSAEAMKAQGSKQLSLVAEMKVAQEKRRAMQRTLLDLAKAVVPKEDLRTIAHLLAKAETPKQFEESALKIKRYGDVARRRVALRRLQDELKNNAVDKLLPKLEDGTIWRDALKSILGKYTKVNPASVVRSMIKSINNMRGGQTEAAEQEIETKFKPLIDAYSSGHKILAEMMPAEIDALVDLIRMFKAVSRLSKQIMDGRQARDLMTAVDQMIDDVEDRSAKVPENVKREVETNRKGWIGQFIELSRSGFNIAKRLGPKGVAYFYDAPKLGESRMKALQQHERDRINEALNRHGLDITSTDTVDWLNEWKSIDVGGKTVKITRGELIELAGVMQDPSNVEHVLKNGIEIKRKKDSQRIMPTETDVADIYNQLDAAEADVLTAITKSYRIGQADAINEVSVIIDGWDRATNPLYFPRSVDTRERHIGFNGFWGWNSELLNEAGFLQERVKHGNPLMVGDALQMWHRRLAAVARYHGFALPVWNAHRLMNAPGFQKTVTRLYGEQFIQNLKERVDSWAGHNDIPTDILSRVMNWLINKASIGALGLNPSPAMTNAAGLSTASALLDGVFESASRLAASPRLFEETVAEMMAYSPILRDRYEGPIARIVTPLIEGGNPFSEYQSALSRKWDAVGEAAMSHIQFADKAISAAIWLAAEKKVKTDNPVLAGQDLKLETARLAEQVIGRTQNPTSLIDQSGIALQSRKNPFLKLFTVFQSAANAIFNLVDDAIDSYRHGEIGKEAMAKNISWALIGSSIIAASARSLLRLIPAAIKGDDDEKKDAETWLGQIESVLATLAGEAAGTIYGFNSVMAPVMKRIKNEVAGSGGMTKSSTLVGGPGSDMMSAIADTAGFAADKLSDKRIKSGLGKGQPDNKNAWQAILGGMAATALVGVPQYPVRLARAGISRLELGKQPTVPGVVSEYLRDNPGKLDSSGLMAVWEGLQSRGLIPESPKDQKNLRTQLRKEFKERYVAKSKAEKNLSEN